MTDNLRDENVVADDSVNKLYDATIIDANGDKVGGVGQVYLDDVTNEPNWVTVNTGFLGLKETFIPLQSATIEGNTIRVPFDKELIKGAPAIDPDGHIDEAQEAELYRYYNVASTDTTVTPTADVADHDIAPENLADGEAVVHEERLNVGKERVEVGRARLRKHVVTEHQTVTVPVQKEKLVIEREPINEVVDGEHRLTEGESEIVLHEERPVISKETVATEKVSLSKEVVTDQQQVSAEVGKERVEVVQDDVDGLRDDRSLADKTDGNPTT